MPRDVADSGRPRVAVCLAGAWRLDSFVSWQTIRDRIVRPADAAVFATHSNDVGMEHGRSDAVRNQVTYVGKEPSRFLTPEDLRDIIGSSLRAVVVWEHRALLAEPLSIVIRWAGEFAANATGIGRNPPPALLMNWMWHLKRWACQALIAADPRGPYDIVVTARPDLIVTRDWHFARPLESSGASRSGFSLAVGHESDPPVYFGENEIVMSHLTNDFSCVNDWAAVSTFAASTTLEQLIHHAYSSLAFLHQNRTACVPFRHRSSWPWLSTCCEAVLSTYLWRVGLERQTANLHMWPVKQAPPHLGPYLRYLRNGSRSATAIADREDSADGHSQSRGLCAISEHRRFGQTPMRHPLVNQEVWEWVRGPNCSEAQPNRTAGRPAELVSTCWQRKYDTGMATKKLHITCAQAALPVCQRHVDLRVPLKPCVRESPAHVVTNVSGYGEAFPWWRWCDGACSPMPNVSFDFAGNGTLEAAVVFPHRGKAVSALYSYHVHAASMQ